MNGKIRKIPLCGVLIFFYLVFPLAAQSQDKVSIYVPEVTGYGNSPSDNIFITRMLENEVITRNYLAAYELESADYILEGTLSALSDNDDDQYEKLSVFHLMLKDAKTGEILVEEDLIYATLDEINEPFTLLMLEIFSQNLGKDLLDTGGWSDKWLYFGANAFWTPRMYNGTRMSFHPVNFGGGISAEIFFHRLFAFETGLEFATDWVVVSELPGDYYQDLLLEIPLLIKYLIRPGGRYFYDPYAGFQINASLFKTTIPAALSFSAGCQFALKAGQGLFYADPRFTVDLWRSGLTAFRDPYSNPYNRFIFHIGIGYKVGIFSRQQPLGDYFQPVKNFFGNLFTGKKPKEEIE